MCKQTEAYKGLIKKKKINFRFPNRTGAKREKGVTITRARAAESIQSLYPIQSL